MGTYLLGDGIQHVVDLWVSTPLLGVIAPGPRPLRPAAVGIPDLDEPVAALGGRGACDVMGLYRSMMSGAYV